MRLVTALTLTLTLALTPRALLLLLLATRLVALAGRRDLQSRGVS